MNSLEFNVEHYDLLGSTQDEIKSRIESGACKEGLVIVAKEQSAGRGRKGRSFASARGLGLYLSLALRPQTASPELTSTFTAWLAVACARSIETLQTAPSKPAEIKWINDVYLNNKKAAGILCELVPAADGGAPFLVCGIGINVFQSAADFGPELSEKATSLKAEGFSKLSIPNLEQSLLKEIAAVYSVFPKASAEILAEYKARNLVKDVQVNVIKPGSITTAYALDISNNFGLIVVNPDGATEELNSGEVSVIKTDK